MVTLVRAICEIGVVQEGMEGEAVKKAVADNSLKVLFIVNGTVAKSGGGIERVLCKMGTSACMLTQ